MGRTSRNHPGLIFWTTRIPPALRTMHIEIEPIDATKRQYGIVLVYGSILEPAGGSVVQNAETVVSNKPAYKKSKSQYSQNSLGQDNAP